MLAETSLTESPAADLPRLFRTKNCLRDVLL
jgi:hypothetical protein